MATSLILQRMSARRDCGFCGLHHFDDEEENMSLKEMVPWRWGGLRRWEDDERPLEPFLREMNTLHKEMDRLFDEFWKGSGRSFMPTPPWQMSSEPWSAMPVTPRIDATEDDKAYQIRAELPGMDREDVDITLADGMLTIRGEKKREDEEKGKEYYRKERTFGSFRRTLPVPSEVDESQIVASFRKGVLTIELPKSEEARRKITHIDVKAA
jgi:HSP20 family protein